jgi:hypothetical protein
LNGPFEDFERGDGFIDLGFSNLDVYLIRNSTGQTVASSISTVENLEHIFAEIPANDSYRIEVDLNDPTGESFPVPYALAWWAGADLQEPVGQGDFNSDGNVDAADYVMWRKTNGSSMEYGEWVENFGSSSGSGGAVPEPAGVVMAVVLAACVGVGRGRWGGRIAAAVKVEILEVFSV